MKKLYFIFLFAALTVVSYAQQITVSFAGGADKIEKTTYNGLAPSEQGSTIAVTGSYATTYDGHDVTKVSVNLIEIDKGNGWATVASYGGDIEGGDSGAAVDGTIDHTYTIPGDVTLSADLAAQHAYLLQVRIFYGTGSINTYINANVTVVVGNAVEGTISVGFNGGAEVGHTLGSPTGPVSPGSSVAIAGTHSADHLGAAASSVVVTLAEVNSSWVDVGSKIINETLAINGTDISYSLSLPSDLAISSSLASGNFYLIQVKAIYSTGTLYVNSRLTVDGTSDIEAVLGANIQLSPNPMSIGGAAVLQTSGLEGAVSVDVFNLVGAKVYSVTSVVGEGSIVIEGLSQGLYTVLVSDGKNKATKKLVVR